jgi:hypothetical protein
VTHTILPLISREQRDRVFLGAAESKEQLVRGNLPHITIRHNRGGGIVAAAAVNAPGRWL